MMIMHAHNTSIRIRGKLVLRPITASPLKGTDTSLMTTLSPMGIMPKERLRQQTMSSDHWEMDVSTRTMDLDLIMSVYHKSQQKLYVKRGLSDMISWQEWRYSLNLVTLS